MSTLSRKYGIDSLDLLIGTLLFFVPIFSFLKPANLIYLSNLDYIFILISSLLLLVLFILISLLVKKSLSEKESLNTKWVYTGLILLFYVMFSYSAVNNGISSLLAITPNLYTRLLSLLLLFIVWISVFFLSFKLRKYFECYSKVYFYILCT